MKESKFGGLNQKGKSMNETRELVFSDHRNMEQVKSKYLFPGWKAMRLLDAIEVYGTIQIKGNPNTR